MSKRKSRSCFITTLTIRIPHSTLRIRQGPSQSPQEVEVNEPREVGWWVLQWGPEAKVLEPESLRQELCETAQPMAALYAQR